MNFYFDFDSTLYNTTELVNRLFSAISNRLCETTNQSFEYHYNECKELFNNNNIDDIYKLIDLLAKKYSANALILRTNIYFKISNSSDLVYEDAISFLKKIKSGNNKLHLLTYTKNLDYQFKKVYGSKIAEYFDSIIFSTSPKHDLNLDYSNSIFIDDNPQDLEGLYSKNPKMLIRLRRNENKYSKIDISNFNLIECASFDEVCIDDLISK